MDLGLVASTLLGIAFLVAGGSKIAAGPQWPVQALGLGAPRAVVPVLPYVELVIGALLVVGLARPFAVIAALLLLVAFTVLIAKLLRAGRRPPCACFGAWSAKPLGPGHIARNAALIALSILALF